MRESGIRRVAKRASELTDECICATCRRPIVDEVKHCALDDDGGPFVLCDPCYLQDERRYVWENRGNPFPLKLGRVAGGR
jgi:hypothetical protein